MPQMGYDMQEGTVVRWLKAEGSHVEEGEPVAEIETDKAVVEFESYASGVLQKILVEEGATVDVGVAIAVVGEPAAEAPPAAEPQQPETPPSAEEASPPSAIPLGAASEPAAPAPVSEEAVEPQAPAAPPTPPARVFATPVARHMAAEHGIDLSDLTGSGPRGRIVREDVERAVAAAEAARAEIEAAAQAAAEEAARLEAEQAAAEEAARAEAEAQAAAEAEEAARLEAERAAAEEAARAEAEEAEMEAEPEPEPVEVVAEVEAEPVAEEAEEEAEPEPEEEPEEIVAEVEVEPAVEAEPEPEPVEAVAEAEEEPEPEEEPVEAAAEVEVEPAVEADPEPEPIEASAEVEAEPVEEEVAAAEPEEEPEPQPEADAPIPLSRMRRQIARVTSRSKSEKPHFYVNVDVDMTEAMLLRARINQSLASEGVRATVNDLIIAASVKALKRFPKFNAYYEDGGIRENDSVNVGIAMALSEGLIMPAIVGAGDMSLREVAIASKDIAERAQRGALSSEEYSGGTFAISNMGMMGVSSFVAIIQPPQTAVLAVGAVQKRAVVAADDSIAVRQMMTATLSADHRIVDGAEGAMFINEIKDLLEDPLSIVL